MEPERHDCRTCARFLPGFPRDGKNFCHYYRRNIPAPEKLYDCPLYRKDDPAKQ